jgi:hypothetical protein
VYNFRQSGNWRLLAATGVSAEVAGNTYIRYIFEDNQTQNITVDKTNRTVALLFQFGWINKLANRNQVSFSFRYMQDVVPAKNQEIHRYLNMLSFQVAYWFSV